MSLELYGAFVAASAILMMIPGPNVALIIATSVSRGARFGLLTVAGSCCAMVIQLAVVALGMTSLLGVLGNWFGLIRWIGVAYLLWLGVRAWRAQPAGPAGAQAQPPAWRAVFARGFLVSLTNPKTLFFYGAFFPQFVSAPARAGSELLVLSATFLAVAAVFDSGWALMAGRLRRLLSPHGRLHNRLAGGALIAAGAGLALARQAA